MQPTDSAERRPATVTRAVARVVLTVYGIFLALIALWPVPVDSNASGFLLVVTRIFPALTYPRIEFSANILLFVPLGVLLTLILRRRYLILPIAIAVTVAIECSQGLLLDRRTPSELDIIANTAGACIGMLIVAVLESWRSRPSRAAIAAPHVATDAEKWAALGFAPSVVPPRPPLPSASARALAAPGASGADARADAGASGADARAAGRGERGGPEGGN